MRITRKKGKGIRIEHNKKLFWIIIVLLAVLILLIYFIAKNNKTDREAMADCAIDNDCVPATCCHPAECVPVEKAPDCKNIMCSMVCSGPLDCAAGYCGCVEGKCEVVVNK